MSCLGPGYNPIPPRLWSRVQNSCSYGSQGAFATSKEVYVPYLKKSIPLSRLAFQLSMLNKGNVLQYKKNSSNITKQQKYSQIAKGMWVNRTSTWATQTDQFSNPNTNLFKRVNVPNNVTLSGEPTFLPITCPNPIPYTYPEDIPSTASSSDPVIMPPPPPTPVENIPMPTDKIIDPPIILPTVVADGGSLACNTIENPCTGFFKIRPSNRYCYPTSASDVPGSVMNLCYNDSLPTYYAKTRLTMPTSGNKWPDNAKFLRSANSIKPYNRV
jgi:hypothetical protein